MGASEVFTARWYLASHLLVEGLNIIGCSSSIAVKKSTIFLFVLDGVDDVVALLVVVEDDGFDTDAGSAGTGGVDSLTVLKVKTYISPTRKRTFRFGSWSCFSFLRDGLICPILDTVLFEIRIVEILLESTS